MGLGGAIRGRLGKFEVPASNLYRSFFINLGDLAVLVHSLFPDARRILEVGCGDGIFASRLDALYPRATYVGLDIAAEPGRLFGGGRDRFSFHSMQTSDYLKAGPDPFDLTLLVDVMHHVPEAQRDDLLADLRALTAPGGHYVLKDWAPSRTPGHFAAFAADRFISGTPIWFLSAEQMRQRLKCLFPADELITDARIPPRRNNLFLAYRRQRPAPGRASIRRLTGFRLRIRAFMDRNTYLHIRPITGRLHWSVPTRYSLNGLYRRC